jgi:hypothetical protein
MFALGIGGWLSITAIPLFLFYSLLALILSISVYLINKSTDSFRFNITALPLIGYTSLAWLTSILLFFLLAILNNKFTQYSGNTIFKLYPLIQQVVGVLIFYFLCKSCLYKKTGKPEISNSKRNLLSAGVAAIPTTFFVLAVNTWHLLR